MLAPLIGAGRAAGGAVHGHDFAEGDAQRAEAGHAQRAHGEIFVIGIELHLHRAGQLHLVLLFVGGDGAIDFGLHVRQEQVGFFFVELDDGGVVLEGNEILVAIEQAQAVYGGGVAIAIVVAHLELLERLIVLAEAHQVDAQFRARRPELADRLRWPCGSRRCRRHSGD